MTETLVAPLLPKIGQRARFMAKLDLLKNEVSNDVLSLSSNGSIRSLRKQEFESFCLLCFICQKLFCGWHSLSVHFKVYHSLMPSSNYICGQGGCQRDFQSLKGLRRHIFSEHSKLLSNNSRAHSVADSTGSCDAKLHTVEDEFSGNDVSQSPDIVETRSFFDENGVCLAAARFIAKLKSHSSIPASTVDQIVEDVQEFFSSDLIHLLHCKTKHLLETFNIDMNDSMVLSLLDDFSHLGDLFTGLKSQHQQLKFFQNSGCYIAPEAITSLRFESKHGEAKRTAHMICNFRNISKSLAHKHQLKFCYRIFSNDSLSEYDLVVGTGNMVVSDTIDGDETEISLSQFGIKCPLFNAKWITLNGTTYRPGQTLLIGVMNDMPLFGELICVFVDNDRIVHFIVNELDTICYVEHFNVYEVEKTCKQKYITPQDLLDHRSLQCRRLPSRKEFQHVVKLHAAL